MIYKRIRDLREDHDLTQAQVGQKINVPQRTYAYYETGRVSPSYPTLLKLSELFDVSCDYLIDDRIPVKEFPAWPRKSVATRIPSLD